MNAMSVLIVAHNEAHTIRDCLESITWADEIVVVDCDSTDGTGAIVREFTSNVVHRPNNYNPEVSKDFGLQLVTGDWVLLLDADERVTPELAAEIKQVLNDCPRETGFRIPMKTFWRKKWLKHGGFYPILHLRLFRRGMGRYCASTVHTQLQLNGDVGVLHNHMLHYAFLNVWECIEKLNRYSEVEAQHKFATREPRYWARIFYQPAKYFVKTYVWKRGFLDGWEGFVVSVLSVMTIFAHYLKYIDELKASEQT